MLDQMNANNLPLAKVLYLKSDFQVLAHGSHVICAISGKMIPLDELKYWNPDRQEAYVDAQASLEAEKRAGTLK